MEGVEHQQGMAQLFARRCSKLGVVQQFHQGGDVIAAEHGAEQFHRHCIIDEGRGGFPPGHSGQESGFDIGSLIDTGGNPV